MATTQAKIEAQELLADPRYYLFDTLPEQGQTRFLMTNERELAAAPFVDIRFEPQATRDFLVNSQELVALMSQHAVERPKTNFIFHHAFVCSTLLARCLNQIPAFYSLKEPWILRRLADIKRQHAGTIPEPHWREMINTYMPLLAKQYKSGESLVIKASNVANNLLYDVLNYLPEQPILYMHSDIAEFLVSNLKKPAETQRKMPGLLADFAKDSDISAVLESFPMPTSRTLLQTCALIWVRNIHTLKQAASKYGTERLRCLDMADFLSSPKASLNAVSVHFGHVPSEHDMVKMTASEVLGKNAKDTRYRYDSALKSEEEQRILAANRQEIDDIVEWVTPLVDGLDLHDFLHENRLMRSA
ncbi:MAG: hypothetical protein OER97_01030 [Gammaproteobacteria bacterium]|nr:hypothetical protein [Gammaproteobacteria bacterium]